jgi:tetratricopeptide (TPR) repeat protein
VAICQDAELPFYFPLIAAPLVVAYSLGGCVAEAVPLLTQALEQTRAMERADFQVFCRLSLGEAQLRAGRLEEAQALADQALALACERHERGHEASALRLLGDIAAQHRPSGVGPAEAYYQQAVVLAEELGMRPLHAHCHLGLGTLYAKMDQRELARAELSTAIDLYRAMDMTFWLPQAEAVLAQVEGR